MLRNIQKDEFPQEVTVADEVKAQEELQRVCFLHLDELSMEAGLPFSMGRTFAAATWRHMTVVGKELDTYFDDNTPVPRRAMQRVVDDELVVVRPELGRGMIDIGIGQRGVAPSDQRLTALLPFNGRGFEVGLMWGYVHEVAEPVEVNWVSELDDIKDFCFAYKENSAPCMRCACTGSLTFRA